MMSDALVWGFLVVLVLVFVALVVTIILSEEVEEPTNSDQSR